MLRRRLTLPAAGIALVLSLVLTALGVWAGNAIVSTMSNQLIAQMIVTVRREVDDMIAFGERMSTRMINDIARNDVSLSDPVAIRRQLYGQVSDEPNVRWLACGNEEGGMTDAGRLADGTIVFLMTDDFRAGVYREYEAFPDGRIGKSLKSGVYFDTREQPWYKTVRDTRATYWTEPYLGMVERLLGVGLSTPVFNKDGSVAGVCNVKLIFTALSAFMSSLHLGDNGRAFIVDSTGQLIAASGRVLPVAIGADGKELPLQASDAADPVVRETARYLRRHPEIDGSPSKGPQVFSFDDPERGMVYAAVDRFEAPGALRWSIVSAVPTMDFLGPVYRAAYLSIAIGAAIIAAFLALELWIIGRTLRPLTALTRAAQAIAKGEWRDVSQLRQSDEVGLLAQAFTVMTTRLKETLDGLRRSEAELEEAQRVAHLGHWERNLDTNRITWSDETYRIFGLTPGETITSAAMLERVHPDDRPIWCRAVAEAMHGGRRYELEYRVLQPNGELRIVHSQGDLTKDSSGRPRSIFGTIQDITDRKLMEVSLRQREQELREVVETIPAMTVTVLPDGSNVFIGKRFAEYSGLSPEQAQGTGWKAAIHPEDLRLHVRTWRASLASGEPVEIETRFRRADGEYRWFLARAVPLRNEAGNIFKWYEVLTDIEDRKRAETVLREREMRIRRLIDANIIGIFIFASEGRIIEANDAFLRIIGYDRDDVVSGRIHWMDLTPPEWGDRDARRWLPEFKRTGILPPFEKEFFRKDGSRVAVLKGVAALDEQRDQGVAFVIDLTERKQAEQALQQAQAELAHANRVATMGQLTGSIAHEINQPIAAVVIGGQVALRSLAGETPDLEAARRTIERMIRDANRAGSIIDRIRSLIAKAPPRKDRLDINEAIREVIEFTRSEATKHGVLVQTQLAGGLPLIQGDRVQLQQVIINLVINAIEAMSGASEGVREVLVTTGQAESGGVLVTVRDSGPGLAPETLDRLFDAFYSTKPSGLGLGLSICRSIIEEAHEGRLWASANRPRGAIFQFTVPADPVSAP